MGMVHPDIMAIAEDKHFVRVIPAQFVCTVTAQRFGESLWQKRSKASKCEWKSLLNQPSLQTCRPVCKGTLWLNVFYD